MKPSQMIPTVRRTIRNLSNSAKHVPIVIVDGDAPPVRKGRGYYHTTLSGKTVVRHPNAYGYRTWYHPSTVRVEVGQAFVDQLFHAAAFL